MTGIRLASLALLLLPSLVFAHGSGQHLNSWSAGVLHPFLGWDHGLVLVAGGLWLGQQSVHRLRLAATFLVLMMVGIAVGIAYQYAQLEKAITVTLVVMGALVASEKKVRPLAVVMILGSVALVHGFVHGSELIVGATSAWRFTAGLLVSSGMMFGIAAVLASRCNRLRRGVGAMVLGALVAVFGILSGI